MLRYWLAFIVFVALVVALAYGLQRDPSLVSSPLIDQEVPAFEAPLVMAWDTNETFNSEMLRGEWSLLNVWASWCVTCLEEHPLLMHLASQIPIYGINHKDVREEALHWLKEHGNPYRQSAFDGDGNVGIDLGVYNVPETFLIDAEGVIRYKHIGALTDEVWQGEILPRIRGERS